LIDWTFFNNFDKNNNEKDYNFKKFILEQTFFLKSSPINKKKYNNFNFFLNYNEFEKQNEIKFEKIQEYRINNINLKSILKV
jgi:hypothetical protein